MPLKIFPRLINFVHYYSVFIFFCNFSGWLCTTMQGRFRLAKLDNRHEVFNANIGKLIGTEVCQAQNNRARFNINMCGETAFVSARLRPLCKCNGKYYCITGNKLAVLAYWLQNWRPCVQWSYFLFPQH